MEKGIKTLPKCIGECGRDGWIQYGTGFACGECINKLHAQYQKEQTETLRRLNNETV